MAAAVDIFFIAMPGQTQSRTSTSQQTCSFWLNICSACCSSLSIVLNLINLTSKIITKRSLSRNAFDIGLELVLVIFTLWRFSLRNECRINIYWRCWPHWIISYFGSNIEVDGLALEIWTTHWAHEGDSRPRCALGIKQWAQIHWAYLVKFFLANCKHA